MDEMGRIMEQIARFVSMTMFVVLVGMMPEAAHGEGVPSSGVHVWDWDAQGAPTLIIGDLGTLGPGEPAAEAARFLTGFVSHLGGGVGQRAVRWMVLRAWEDELDTVHVRLRPWIRGLPVAGAEVLVHAEAASGRVYAVGGTMLLTPPPARVPRRSAALALERAMQETGWTPSAQGEAPALSYVLRQPEGSVALAWRHRFRVQRHGAWAIDELFADALRGGLAAHHRWIHHSEGGGSETVLAAALPCPTQASCAGPSLRTAEAHHVLLRTFLLHALEHDEEEHELGARYRGLALRYLVDLAGDDSAAEAYEGEQLEQVFALLVEESMPGRFLGFDPTLAIIARALGTYLTPVPGLAAVHHAMVLAAADLYGMEGAEVEAVRQAWCAVGVGECGPLHACWRVHALSAAWQIHPAGDLDGDGSDEVFLHDPAVGAGVVVGAGYGSSLRTERTSKAPRGGPEVVAAGDLDGDGRHEVFLYERAAGEGTVYARQGRDGYGAVWSTDTLRTTWEIYPAGDLDGDGRAELFLYDRQAGDGEVFALREGGGYTTVWHGSGLRTTWQVHPAGDLDGDGRAELFLYDPQDGAGLLFGHRADGGLGLERQPDTDPDAAVIPLGDVNGDGRSELLFHDAKRGTGSVYGRR